MATPLDALKKFSRQDPTPEYFARSFAEVSEEKNERGAVILLAANLELCLRSVIKWHRVTTGDVYKMSFHEKIRIGSKKGLYGPETKHNLENASTFAACSAA